MDEKLPSQRLSVCHMEIQMRKIQAAQRGPCLNAWVDVQFILAGVCYTFVEPGVYSNAPPGGDKSKYLLIQ